MLWPSASPLQQGCYIWPGQRGPVASVPLVGDGLQTSAPRQCSLI